jgi:hypothetical protein
MIWGIMRSEILGVTISAINETPPNQSTQINSRFLISGFDILRICIDLTLTE